MTEFDISYPTLGHKNYTKFIYEYCLKNRFSLILKGSLSKGTATKYSDIDLIILGDINACKANEIINLYGMPIMTNFTENPKGILILVYSDTVSVDLDIRETISQEDLKDSKVLLKYDENFLITNREVVRKEVIQSCMPHREDWYKTLRLIHRGSIKYLSKKIDNSYNLLAEIKENLKILGIQNLKFSNNFEQDIQSIFQELCDCVEVDSEIKALFSKLFKKF